MGRSFRELHWSYAIEGWAYWLVARLYVEFLGKEVKLAQELKVSGLSLLQCRRFS
jgi:hypothetical protein